MNRLIDLASELSGFLPTIQIFKTRQLHTTGYLVCWV
jgi:hypothetical protein